MSKCSTVFLKLSLRNLKFWEKKSMFCTSYCSTVVMWLAFSQLFPMRCRRDWHCTAGCFPLDHRSRFSTSVNHHSVEFCQLILNNLLSSLWRPFQIAFITKYLYFSFLYSVSTMPTMFNFHFPRDSSKGCVLHLPLKLSLDFFRGSELHTIWR